MERAEVIARARVWRLARDTGMWSTLDLAQRLGMSPERLSAFLCASVLVVPTGAEVALLDELLGLVEYQSPSVESMTPRNGIGYSSTAVTGSQH